MATIDHYYTTLANLLGKSIGELERTTEVKASVPKTLSEVAIFYHNAEYDGDYQVFNTRKELLSHLSKGFTERVRNTASNESNNLRMKLAAGWMDAESGHALELNFWTKDGGQAAFMAWNHTSDDEGNLLGEVIQLPLDKEGRTFFCFTPIFHTSS